jgi:opacity protein-like surface antigen
LYGVRTDEEALGFSASETNTKFGFNLGGGLKFLPSDNSPWGVGIDLRWHRIMDTLDGGTQALNVFTGLIGLTFSP